MCEVCGSHVDQYNLMDCEICGKYVCIMCMEYDPVCIRCHETMPEDRFDQIVDEIDGTDTD